MEVLPPLLGSTPIRPAPSTMSPACLPRTSCASAGTAATAHAMAAAIIFTFIVLPHHPRRAPSAAAAGVIGAT